MSEDLGRHIDLPATHEPFRVAARRLSWFRAAFRSVVARVSEETGIHFDLDEAELAECFVSWLRKVERVNPPGSARRAFFEHAAGMMLRELIERRPLTAADIPEGADRDRPEIFWPEGFCYTVFCLNVAAAAIRQEFGSDVTLGDTFTDLGTWWSFRENVQDDRSYSISFFKLFAGSDPGWDYPDLFRWPAETALAAGPIPKPLS